MKQGQTGPIGGQTGANTAETRPKPCKATKQTPKPSKTNGTEITAAFSAAFTAAFSAALRAL